jgi:hypothetical protein
MYEAAASCKNISLTWGPVTNWEPHRVTCGAYCYAVLLYGIQVSLVAPYRVSHL